MQLQIPESIRALAPGRLIITPIDSDAVIYLREEDWGMKKYPRQCPAELRLGTWEIDGVMTTVVLLRLARSDLTTFEFWLNAGDPNGVRTLQCLGSQTQVDVHIVADRMNRSLRVANVLRFDASMIVNRIRGRNAWPPEDFQAACSRVAQLYPTPYALWWACEAAGDS
jgi:hypothetical protein